MTSANAHGRIIADIAKAYFAPLAAGVRDDQDSGFPMSVVG